MLRVTRLNREGMRGRVFVELKPAHNTCAVVYGSIDSQAMIVPCSTIVRAKTSVCVCACVDVLLALSTAKYSDIANQLAPGSWLNG